MSLLAMDTRFIGFAVGLQEGNSVGCGLRDEYGSADFLRQAVATGCWSAELCRASQKTGRCGQRQVLRASERWSATMRTAKFATLDQCGAIDRT